MYRCKTNLEQDAREELLIMLTTLRLLRHPIQQIQRHLPRFLSSVQQRYCGLFGSSVVVTNCGDLRNKILGNGLEKLGKPLQLLSAVETVDGEGDGGIDPFLVAAELGPTEHAARDARDDFGHYVDDVDFGPVWGKGVSWQWQWKGREWMGAAAGLRTFAGGEVGIECVLDFFLDGGHDGREVVV